MGAAGKTQVGVGAGAGAGTGPEEAEAHRLARGRGAAAGVAVCGRASAARASRLFAIRAPPGTVAGGRSGREEQRSRRSSGCRTCPRRLHFSNWCGSLKHRWIVDRDYLELKQELGLGHFEGRSRRGFHHHATLCIAAYGFLVAERSRISASARAGKLELEMAKAAADSQARGSSTGPAAV